MRTSQAEIAENLGLSQQAVSKALRGDADISAKVRERVEAEAKRLGYRKNKLARSLLSGTTGLVGLFLPNFSSPYFLNLFNAIEDGLGQNGYQVLAKRWDRHTGSDAVDLDALLQYRVDGLLVSPRHDTAWEDSVYAELLGREMKMVSVSGRVGLPGIPHVGSDDLGGANTAVKHLLANGHRSIVYVGPADSPDPAIVNRRSGYLKTMADAGLEAKELDVLDARLDSLLSTARPTAFFCGGDLTAVELIRLLRERNLAVPNDISVMGYGDNLACPQEMKVPLTTVSQHSERIGATAVEMLMKLLAGQDVADVDIPAEIIVRESVKCINNRSGT